MASGRWWQRGVAWAIVATLLVATVTALLIRTSRACLPSHWVVDARSLAPMLNGEAFRSAEPILWTEKTFVDGLEYGEMILLIHLDSGSWLLVDAFTNTGREWRRVIVQDHSGPTTRAFPSCPPASEIQDFVRQSPWSPGDPSMVEHWCPNASRCTD